MDKMMDAGNMLSLVSGSKPTGKKSGTATDGDVFSRVLEQTTGKSEKSADKTREAISSDKKDDKNKPLDKQAAELEEKLRGKMFKPGELTGMANYIYNIVLKSPESLSMAEKQAFKVGEFAQDGVGIKEFQKMLSDRGIKLNDLTFSQIAQLTQRNSKGQINAFLDDLLKQMRDGTVEKRLKMPLAPQTQSADETRTREKTERKGSEAAQSADTHPVQPFVGMADARPSQQTQEIRSEEARKEQRENVIKQIIEKLEIRSVGDKTEMTLKLNPEYLGDMRIKLSTENGKLSAQFETTSAEVRELLEEGWHGLQETFQRKGLNLATVSTHLVDSIT